MTKLTEMLAAVTAAIMGQTARQGVRRMDKPSPLKDHAIIGMSEAGCMNGQRNMSTRKVYRAQYVGRSKYTPHQGAQECTRRIRQNLAEE